MDSVYVTPVRHPGFVIAVRWLVAFALGSFAGLTGAFAAVWLCLFYDERSIAVPIGWIAFVIVTVGAAWRIFDRTIPELKASDFIGLLSHCTALVGLIAGIGLQARVGFHDLAVFGLMLAGYAAGLLLGGLYRLVLNPAATDARSAPSAV